MIDYALWEVIENAVTLQKIHVVEGVTTKVPITTAEEKDAKKLLEAVKNRFGGNAATKKTQRNLLKQQYENFTTPSSEMLDQTFDKLQKLVSQLELLEEKLSQEDVYEPEVKGMSSSNSSTQNMAFVSSLNNNTSSANGAFNTTQVVNNAPEVSTTSTQVNVANSTNIDNLSDAVICSFFARQPNSPQLVHEDLEQFHPDDMEEMDLRWQMAMLTMRARRECRAPRYQDNKHKESSRKSVHVETSASTALVSYGKEIVITESSVRRDLQLADEEGIDGLLSSTIVEQLALMGKPKRKDTHVPQPSGPTDNVVDDVFHKELGDTLVESFSDKESLGEDAFKQGRRIDTIDADEDIILVNNDDNDMFDVNDLGEITLAQALEALKTLKPKVKGIVFQEPEMFDKSFKRVNTFEDFRIEVVEGKEKRPGTKLEQEITKKQKVNDDKEKAELKQLMETIPDAKEVAIDAIPLAIKSSRIIDWKIHKVGKKSYYQIVRADE
uniref:Uncharacterized protein n=1 Tax=Tanacetum cinerariifolium TaxID=118510 RepID=A0A6L2M540_TANCI|nr:hypothetical protein [Tanacetum cinerariifolium]